MDDRQLGVTIRLLRHRRGWRQVDLAIRAGVSAGIVGSLERGKADGVSVTAIRKVAKALEFALGWDVGYLRAELARLRDADHARCAEVFMKRLVAMGWIVHPETSFNHYGDRGRIDLLAYHPPTGVLLVIEIKTVIADVQDLLGALDVKHRVATGVARSMGLQPRFVTVALVVMENSTNRRRLAEHPHLFTRFALRGRKATTWLRDPGSAQPTGLLAMLKLPERSHADVRRAGRRRVRVGAARASVEEGAGTAAQAIQRA
jgi:transcriptional regulator with XRE-family HTH domain